MLLTASSLQAVPTTAFGMRYNMPAGSGSIFLETSLSRSSSGSSSSVITVPSSAPSVLESVDSLEQDQQLVSALGLV
jgi:hypothetical protein